MNLRSRSRDTSSGRTTSRYDLEGTPRSPPGLLHGAQHVLLEVGRSATSSCRHSRLRWSTRGPAALLKGRDARRRTPSCHTVMKP